MALFGDKKTKKNTTQATSAETAAAGRHDVRDVLLRPRITEKATTLAERNVYTFEIHKDANKSTVAEAVEKLYSVKPMKVRIVSGRQKRVFVRGHKGMKAGVKKAYVYLKEGDRIELV